MKRLGLAIALPLALLCFAHADSIPTLNVLQANYSFFAGTSGDNGQYSLIGPGINLQGGGSVVCSPASFCESGSALTPGMLLVPSLSVDFESFGGSVTINGHTFNGRDEVFLFISSIHGVGFRLPSGGQSIFKVTVPAAFELVQGEVVDGTMFDVNIPPGKLTLTFKYAPASSSYYFVNGAYITAPEPGTISLVVTGLVAILGGVRRKRTQPI